MITEDQLKELDEQGSLVSPGLRDRETTSAIRSYVDELAGPVIQADEPEDRSRVHNLRHQMPGEIMPKLASDAKTIELGESLVGSRDIRIREQVFFRTDLSAGNPGPTRWHIDNPFLSSEHDCRPRKSFFQLVTFYSRVESGSGAFMIVPGSHRLAYAALADAKT